MSTRPDYTNTAIHFSPVVQTKFSLSQLEDGLFVCLFQEEEFCRRWSAAGRLCSRQLNETTCMNARLIIFVLKRSYGLCCDPETRHAQCLLVVFFCRASLCIVCLFILSSRCFSLHLSHLTVQFPYLSPWWLLLLFSSQNNLGSTCFHTEISQICTVSSEAKQNLSPSSRPIQLPQL